MLARCVATLKPPPELTLSQWADRYRMLSAESSAEPGRWHTDKAPYQREIMDAIGDAHIRRVVIMCAAQLGKTELLLNILGYFMAYAPAPILVMQPTLDMGQTFSKDRLAPMIRDTPVLRGLVDVKSRYAGNTILKKNFPGGHITIVGANSATGLASRPIKVLLADEVDRYPGSAGTEGDPLSLAQKRQTTFWDKKTVMVSTPVIKGHSRIETEYNQSTREEWNVPCPECGHYQPFVWANLIFDPDDLQKEIIYKCERCGCVANEYRWKQQSQQGRFVAENPGAETRGFHLNTLASTFCGWKEIVQKFIVAKEQLDQGNPEGMKVWVNTELGETWEERGEQVEDTELFNRREIYDAVVPEEVLVLTAGVDVQDDRFEVEIVGWGVGKESWGIRYQKIYGDMLKEQVWEDLDAFLQTVWCKKDGTALRIISCCIDSGGHHTDQVYRFTKERYERGVWAIKGKGGAEVPYIRNPTTNNRVKTPLFIIGVDAGKHRLKIHYYIRYMDDVIILGQDKETLHRWKAAVETFLREELALDLNSKTSIRPVRQGVEFVGVRIWPTHMKLRKSTVRRIKREVRKISALYAAGDMTRQDFYRRIASIRGLLKHTESASLRWRLNEIYRAELEKAKQKQLREEAQHEPFADHSGAGNGDGNAGTGYQDHGNPACRAG